MYQHPLGLRGTNLRPAWAGAPILSFSLWLQRREETGLLAAVGGPCVWEAWGESGSWKFEGFFGASVRSTVVTVY